MGRLLFVLPSVGAGDTVRLDTDSGTDTPADVTPAGGGPSITGALLHAGVDGALPRVLGPADGTDTLYLKELDYQGAATGSPTTLTGSDLDAALDVTAASSVVSRAVIDPLDTWDNSYAGAADSFPGTFQYQVREARDWLHIENTAESLLLDPGIYIVVGHLDVSVTTAGTLHVAFQNGTEGGTFDLIENGPRAVGDYGVQVQATAELTEQTEIDLVLGGSAIVTGLWFAIHVVRLGDIPNP